MNNRQIYRATIRQGIYLVILTLIVFLFWQVGDVYKSSTVQEYGMFETAQSGVLFLIALSFGIQAARNKTYRAILILLCGLALAALIREQDAAGLPANSTCIHRISPGIAHKSGRLNALRSLPVKWRFGGQAKPAEF